MPRRFDAEQQRRRAVEAELNASHTTLARFDDEVPFVYRLLKAEGLLTSPVFIVLKAAERFAHRGTAIDQLWQTDFTYLKVIGWGWYYLSIVLNDFSCYIVALKLCTTMAATAVTSTLDSALQVYGLEQTPVDRRPRLLSDNGPSYVAAARPGLPMALEQRKPQATLRPTLSMRICK